MSVRIVGILSGVSSMPKKTKTKDDWRDWKELDASFFDMMKQMRNEPKEIRDAFLKTLKSGFKDAEKAIVKKAVDEGIITQEEYDKLRKKYMYDGISSLASYIDAVRLQRAKPEDKAIFITMPETPLFKDRKELKKRFGVIIKNPSEQIEVFKKEDPKGFAEMMERRDKELAEESKTTSYIG